MAKTQTPDQLAARIFWITMAGLTAWILSVFLFIL